MQRPYVADSDMHDQIRRGEFMQVPGRLKEITISHWTKPADNNLSRYSRVHCRIMAGASRSL